MPSCSKDIPREFGANGGLKLQDDRDWRVPGRASLEGLNPSSVSTIDAPISFPFVRCK
jgi:hypothetical protein